MTLPSFVDNPTDWDKLVISSATGQPLSVGIVKSIKVRRKKKIDKIEPTSSTGAALIYKGIQPAEIDATLLILDTDGSELKRLENLIKEIFPPGTKGKQEPRDMSYPSLAVHGIKKCVVEEIEGPSRPDKNTTEITLKILEYLPPPKTPDAKKLDQSLRGFTTTYDTNVSTYETQIKEQNRVAEQRAQTEAAAIEAARPFNKRP